MRSEEEIRYMLKNLRYDVEMLKNPEKVLEMYKLINSEPPLIDYKRAEEETNIKIQVLKWVLGEE